MSRKLKILAPVRYPWQFNGPRQSRHDIDIRYFLPLNKISNDIEGITAFNPFPLKRFDLIHAFNRIPLGIAPYIIGFESHLPRAFWLEHTAYFRALQKSLAGNRCKAIIAISDYARRHFLNQHKDSPLLAELATKLTVRYPNLPIPAFEDSFEGDKDGKFRLVFVGNHFGRKGGSVSVRLAELAQQRNISLQIDIISSLEVGAMSWTDPLRPGFFDNDLKLLHSLPNIRHHGALPNKDVLALIRQAHFVLLPTFSDTFGYSVIEAMAQYTPAIVSRQGALPEIVDDNVNGIILNFGNTPAGEWEHIVHGRRDQASYETLFKTEVDNLAEQACNRLEAIMNTPAAYAAMRASARAKAKTMFSADDANVFWDDFYERVAP